MHMIIPPPTADRQAVHAPGKAFAIADQLARVNADIGALDDLEIALEHLTTHAELEGTRRAARKMCGMVRDEQRLNHAVQRHLEHQERVSL